MYRDSQEQEAVMRVQRKKIRSGRKGNKRFVSEGGAGVMH